jgi:hypothetical protein
MHADVRSVRLLGATDMMWVYEGMIEERQWGIFKRTRRPIRIVDHQGFVKLQREAALVRQTTVGACLGSFATLWNEGTTYVGDATVYPDMFLILGGRVVDLSGMQALDHALEVARTELEGRESGEALVLIAGLRTQI